MTVMDEIRGMSDEEWGSLWADLLAEFGRRQTMASAPGEIQRITEGYLDARDGTQPEPTPEALADVSAWPAWVQPTGATRWGGSSPTAGGCGAPSTPPTSGSRGRPGLR